MNIWEGEKIRLRGFEPSDIEFLSAWIDTDDARAGYRVEFPISKESQKEWVNIQSKKKGEGDKYCFIIETRDGKPVGSINSHGCDIRVGKFLYGIGIKGDYRRQGYATEAIYLLLNYFFRELRYQKVNVNVFSFNQASISLHEKFGFKLEGRLRRTVFTDGKYYDELLYGMTDEEFQLLHSKNPLTV